MPELLLAIVYTSLAGFALPAGGALASIEGIRPRWLEQEFRHGVLAFGGGILLGAVALVLVPHGMRELSVFWAAATLVSGGLIFFLTDKLLARSGKPASNLVAALLDVGPHVAAADLDLDGRIKLELEYIDNYSVWRDLQIIAQTLPAVVSGKGAR